VEIELPKNARRQGLGARFCAVLRMFCVLFAGNNEPAAGRFQLVARGDGDVTPITSRGIFRAGRLDTKPLDDYGLSTRCPFHSLTHEASRRREAFVPLASGISRCTTPRVACGEQPASPTEASYLIRRGSQVADGPQSFSSPRFPRRYCRRLTPSEGRVDECSGFGSYPPEQIEAN
jgi:hypothetical protein